VLADTLRTDRGQLRILTPDSPATLTLRATCRARKDLVNTRVAVANQLRAHLDSVFPAAAVLFDEVDSPISLSFLTRCTSQSLADWLSPKRLAHWLRAVGYCGRTDPAVMHARLLAAPRGLTGEDGLARAHTTRAYLATLKTLREQITALEQQISEHLAAHPDNEIFTSLPRSGTVRAARLLAEIGDCRALFPTPDSLACLAGVAPSTRASGQSRHVGFRWAGDKQIRLVRHKLPCSATQSATSPATAVTPTPGPKTSTPAPATADTATRPPSGSWPAPGSTSAGTAGRPASPTSPPGTVPGNACFPAGHRLRRPE
jgi:transposase